MIGMSRVSPPRKRLKVAWPSSEPVGETAAAFGEGAKVHAGAERAIAGAGDHDRTHLRVLLRLGQRRAELAHERGVEGVAGLGAVEAEDQDGVALVADQDGLVGHRSPRFGLVGPGATTPRVGSATWRW